MNSSTSARSRRCSIPPVPQISIVSPVYGCRECLVDLAESVRRVMDGCGLTWELVLVDDRGPDEPWPLITELAASDPRVRGVQLARNHGQHLAIWAGLEASRGSWVAVMDCDLQDDPAVIPALHAEALAAGADAVVVERGDWSDSAFRRIASKQFYRLVHILAGVRLKNIGNFGIYSRRMVKILLLFTEQEVFLPMMVSLTGLKSCQMSITRDERARGRSAYSLLKLLRVAVSVIVRYSDRPLKLSAVAGLAVSTLAAAVSACLLIGYALGAFTVPGWTSVALSVWFLSGVIMLVLGIHGFYLGRVFAEVRERPRIMVEETTFDRKEGR